MKSLQKILNSNKAFFKKVFIFLFLFFLPTQLGKHFFLDFSYISGVRIDYLAPTLYFTDCLFVVIFLLFKKTVFRKLRKKFAVILLLTILFFLNLSFSRHFFLAFYRFLKIIELYVVFLIFEDFKDKRIIFFSFFLGGVFQITLVILQLIFQKSLQGIFYFFGERYFTSSTFEIAKISFEGRQIVRPYGTFSHPNSLAGFYLLLYFFFLTFFKFSFLKFLALAVFWLLVFFSFSKVAIFVFLILNVFYLVRRFSFYRCFFCFFSKILVIFLLSFVFLSFKGDPFSLDKRVNLLKNAFQIFASFPVFGVGLGHYLYYQANFPQKYPYFFLQPVHNIFLLFLAETGIILGGAVFYFLFKFIKTHFLKSDSLCFLMCFLTVLITGFFDHYWLTLQQNWLLMGVVFGLIKGLKSGPEGT